jgi:hypothetical protein
MKIQFSFRSAFSFGAALIVGLFNGSESISPASGVAFSPNKAVINNQPQLGIETQNKPFLLAASTQLNNLLYNKTYRVTSIARYYTLQSPSYDAAYYVAWQEFNNIISLSSLQEPRWSTTAGWVYTANLIGGGTANIREYGASSPIMPTIDIIGHNTQPLNGQSFSQVREIKFPYSGSRSCPVSTSSC